MLDNRRRRITAFLTGTLVLLGLLFFSASASAAGRIEWKTKAIKERENKSWRIELTIYLPRPPDTAYVPMKFEFQPTAYYERAMTDGDKLIERTVPLEHQQSIIETVDVGFLDPGTAKIQARTKFSFNVTRAHDYAAGEYRVTIYDVRNNQKIGAPTDIKLEGENEVIDRRSITFSGPSKKEKKKDEGEGEKSEEKADDSGASDAEGADDGEETEQMDLQNMDDEELEKEGEVKEKPGGCGCRVAGAPSSPNAPNPPSALLAMLMLGALAWRRQR